MSEQRLRRKFDIRNLFVLLFALYSPIVSGQTYVQTLDVQIPGTLNLVKIDGNLTAYYELHLTNFSTDTFKLNKLSILNSSNSSIQFSSQDKDLQNRYNRIGVEKKDTTLWLTPGCSSVIYVELSLPDETIIEIFHLITFEMVGRESLGQLKIQTATTKCFANDQLILGKPMSGGPFTTVYDPSWERGHRKVIYTINGKARIPGRYAIDLIKMDDDGRYAKGSEDAVKNWFGYGADVLAVADGVVSSIKDDFSESSTLSGHPGYTADEATGNYISIKIGSNQFAFYEHLKPKSIKVKMGQKVKKGDVIASLGFTGQTTGPHLHFHVADADSPLGAEGIPFVFETFEVLGSYSDFGNFGKSRWRLLNNSRQLVRNKERPFPNCVIKFN